MRANFQPSTQCCSLYLVEKKQFDQISFGLRKDIKGVIRRRYSKGNRQYNGQMKKTTNARQNTTQKPIDSAIRTPAKMMLRKNKQILLH